LLSKHQRGKIDEVHRHRPAITPSFKTDNLAADARNTASSEARLCYISNHNA
jgi:hypothetical protein